MQVVINEKDVEENELPVNKIVFGDAIKVMRKLPKESIDLVFTDPPYNISSSLKIADTRGKEVRYINYDFGEWDHNKITPYDWIPFVYNVLKPNGILIFLYDKMEISCLAKWLEKEYNMKVRHIGVWAKTNPPPQMRKVKWMTATEFFIIATKNYGVGHHYNYKAGERKDYIETPICMGKERLSHPTQKPEKMAIPIIKWWSYPNDVVLDPFCGSGTFCAVTYKLSRRFVGIDNNEKYVEISKKRLEEVMKQQKLDFLAE